MSTDHNMDFQYHICMIKPRLHGLALGGVWQPCSTELVSIHTTNHVCHEKKSCMVFYIYSCIWCFYSYRALICDSHRVLLENNNILTWLQSFQVKIENFLKFLLSLNPYRYQIDAYRAGYKTRDQEF